MDENLRTSILKNLEDEKGTYLEKLPGSEINVIEFGLEILNNTEFQANPVLFMAKWKKERGTTEEFRIPEDIVYDIFNFHCKKYKETLNKDLPEDAKDADDSNYSDDSE